MLRKFLADNFEFLLDGAGISYCAVGGCRGDFLECGCFTLSVYVYEVHDGWYLEYFLADQLSFATILGYGLSGAACSSKGGVGMSAYRVDFSISGLDRTFVYF